MLMDNLARKLSQNTAKNTKTDQIVELKAVTWNKDSHGLFDYENSYYDMKKFVINDNTTILRANNEIVTAGVQEAIAKIEDLKAEPIMYISKSPKTEGMYYIDVETMHQATKRPLYLIIRSLKCKDGRTQRGYSLQPGNIVKLGRVEFKIIEVQTGNDPSTVKVIENINLFPKDTLFDANCQKNNMNNPDQICKYCLLDRVSDDDLDNLMLYPCKCLGSSAGVHFSCLRSWVQYKIIAKHNHNVANYHWKKLECEICLEPLPRRIRYGPNIHELITITRPISPYVIFEKMDGDKKSSSFVLIAPEPGQLVTLGRGHQCDFRISDISVSRIHAHLKIENGQLLIYDNDSKFGTLVLLNDNYPIKDEKAAVQIGRTVFTFVLKNASVGNTQVE